MTFGYSPVMIEHLLDEALVWALRRGAERLNWDDIQQAKMTEEIGLAQPVEYTEAERRTIATHESGHATVAWLVGQGPQARGAVDHQAQGRPRPAGPLRGRGALHPDPDRDRWRSSRSPSAAWWPRSCSSARPAPGWPATCRPPPRPRPRWSGRWAWPARWSRWGGVGARPGPTSWPRSCPPTSGRDGGRGDPRPTPEDERPPAAGRAPPHRRGPARRPARARRARRRRDQRRHRPPPGPGQRPDRPRRDRPALTGAAADPRGA